MPKKKVAPKRQPNSIPDMISFGHPSRPLSEYHQCLVIPKIAMGVDSGLTVALGVKSRAFGRTSPQFERPTRTVSASLNQHVFSDLSRTPFFSIPQTAKGGFRELDSIGMSTAFFTEESSQEEAQNALGDDYEIIPNFELDIPLRVKMVDGAATRGRTALATREWPETSGVGTAHLQGVRGAGVLVGVLDSGIDADHDEIRNQTVVYRYISPTGGSRDIRGIDTDGHGTHVSGIIGGRNVGVAPEINLFVASVIESENLKTSLIRIVAGLNWLLQQFSRPEHHRKPGVLNLSLGFPPEAANALPPGQFDLRLNVMRMLLTTLRNANILPIVAIGNEGPNAFRFPGAFKESLAVGAVDFAHEIAPFSGRASLPNEGKKPDLVGYGVEVYSSIERDYDGRSIYERLSGTSMATPYVTGIASLYRCRQPQLTVDQTIERIKGDAMKLSRQPASLVGSGLAKFI